MRSIEGLRTAKEAAHTLAQRRAAADARASRAIDVLRNVADSRRHQAALDALQRMLLRGHVIRFDTIPHIMEPQPWVTDEQGRLVGHVLTVDAATLARAIDADRLDAMPLPDALERPWADVEARVAWGELYAASLCALADLAEGASRAVQEAAALRRSLDDSKT